MDPKFVHLSVRSDYSITSGLSKPNELIQRAFDLNMPALGMLDYGNFYGVIKFYKSAISMGIKPILGVRFKLRSNFLNQAISKINILAYNNQGYYNLIALISKSHKQKYLFLSDEIIIHQDWLVKYKDGLIILSGGYNGDFGKYLIQNNDFVIKSFIKFYKKYFPSFYYFEILRTNNEFEEDYIKHVILLSKIYHIPIVATNNVCFLNKSDSETHKIRVAIYKGETLQSKSFGYQYSKEQFLKTEKEMCDLFFDLPEALENSVEIAKRCNVFIKTGKYFLPTFPTKLMSTKNFLISKSLSGMNNRLKLLYSDKIFRNSIFKKYQDRLFMELEIINKMGFPGYFLIVMEFVKWAKNNNISVGPGRGSGAGSLVAYCLQITEVDPLSHDLLFERFLNPKRVSMPDFDIDFCMEKRDLVIEHIAQFYGKNTVSQIITFGTMSAKAVVRDVGRVFGYPYGFVNKISQLIPLDPGITLKKALSNQSDLLRFYIQNIEVKKIIDTSQKLEGVIKNIGKHAGGIVIAPKKLICFTPIQYDDHGVFVTQLDKDDIDYIGLLKFDFLGLRTLTIIQSAVKMINQIQKKNNSEFIYLNHIPLDDRKSFNLLKSAETTAVFQLESYGMRDLITRLQPDCFEDIVSLIALFRPGPLQSGMVDNFINRKKKKEPIAYPDIKWQHELLQPILKSTYGIILYQEQVMKIAQVLSGYTLSEADILQRAMSKKKYNEMFKQREYFQKSAQERGISKKLAIKIFDLLEKFAGYGFNKSHSVAYALISYQTLWIKSNYPSEFMSAVMSADLDNTNKIQRSIRECFRMNLKILPPDINISQYYFTTNQQGEIIYGLGAIKGVGRSIVDSIICSRNKVKRFNSLFDFCINVNLKKIGKKTLEKLVFSGALDSFNIERSLLFKLINKSILLSHQYFQSQKKNQLEFLKPLVSDNNTFYNKNYFNNFRLSSSVWSQKMKLDFEKDVLGFYLTGNPMDEYRRELSFYTNNYFIKNLYKMKNNSMVTVSGVISSIRFQTTKNRKKIIFLELLDGVDQIEIIIFGSLISKYKFMLIKDTILILTGRIFLNQFTKKLKLIAHVLMNIPIARNKYLKK
ncbi:DNA polymerase III subunit alpha [Buchnera aphidicola]|uniref:DNA polymerase III subunit alpha n=1 Tax=Buchnera aphidicola TaxID=9 RepID=UPI003464B89A